jgi:hypothetical protein
VLFGHQLTDGIESIRELAAVDSVDGCLESFSPKAEGLIWRLVGPSTEAVGRRLRSRLAFLADHLQETPWERKW